jgi:MFS family permease
LWVLLFTVTLAVVTYVDRVAIGVAGPSIREDLGLSATQFGLALTAFGIAYAAFEIPGGFLGDWLGPRSVLLKVVLMWSFFTAATGWVRNLWQLVAVRFLFGAGEAGCFPNLTKVFTVWFPDNERVRAQGVLWLSARWGGAFTPLLATQLIIAFGWRRSFEIFGVLGVIWAVAFYFWYRDNPLTHPKMNEAEKALLREGASRASGHSDAPWGKLLSSKRVWLLCWQYFFLSYGWYFNITWLPTYLRDQRAMNMTEAAWYGMLPLFMGGLGNPASLAISGMIRRATGNLDWSRRIVASLGMAGACVFLVLTTRMESAPMAVACIALASFCNDFAMPPAWAAAMDMGGKYAGTLSGAMNTWGNLGGALAPAAIGYMLDASGFNWNLTFYVSAVVYALAIPCWLALNSVKPLEETK